MNFNILLPLLVTVGCVGPWPGDEPGVGAAPDVGFVYIGPIGDHGWSKSHDDGRLFLEDALGVATRYRESVIPSDADKAIDDLIAEGANIVFTTSYDYVSQTQQAAANNPDVAFLNCSGNVHDDNLSSYMGRMFQPIYISGYLAGKMSCTGHVGVVASVPIPETVRHINAFALGVQAANPDAVVDVRWVMNWFDPVLEPQFTNELIEASADVIITGTDTTFPIETAEGRTVECNGTSSPVWTIGYDNEDACKHGPESCLTSVYWNWGPLYTELVSAIDDGSWVPSDVTWRPMTASSDSSVGISELSAKVPGDIRFEVSDLEVELTAPGATQLPFIDALFDNKGVQRLSDGEALTDEALDEMCWFVEGVVSTVGGEQVPAVVPPGCGGAT